METIVVYAIGVRSEQFLYHSLGQQPMSNLVKLSRLMKKFSIQALYSDRSVYMTDSSSVPISAVLTNEQLLREKRMCAKFQIAISKTKGLVRVDTNRRIDRPTWLN